MKKIQLILSLYYYIFLSKVFYYLLSSKKKNTKTVCYFAAFSEENAGFHWRVKKWSEILQKNEFDVKISLAIKSRHFYSEYEQDPSSFLIKYLKNRFWEIIQSRKYETVIVRRELLLFNDYGNLFLEKLLLKFHPNAILDFDDDIAFSKNEPRKIKNRYGKLLFENGHKFSSTLKMYNRFIVGSNYLKDYVLSANSKINSESIIVIPTCIDYEKYSKKTYNNSNPSIVFGWIGGNQNLFLLNSIIEPLNRLNRIYNFSLMVISGQLYENKDAHFKITNRQWSLETEIEDLLTIDIGLMPLLETPRDKGKCGFKLIQYMGMGIVSVASAVTVNNDIIEDGISGILVQNENQWFEKLKETIELKSHFSSIGNEARKRIFNNYSFDSKKNHYISFIRHEIK